MLLTSRGHLFLSRMPQVKNHVWVFVNALIENPSFDSQTKENMTLQTKSFGSKCLLSDKFIKAVSALALCCPRLTCGQDASRRVSRLSLSSSGHQLWDCGEYPQLGEVQSSDAAE